MVKMRSPPGVKTTSTGLSMPPVMTGSMPVPSGRQRKMCAALCDERRLAGPLIGLLREGALAPVNPAVGSEVRPVQVVGAAGQRLALEPFDTLVRDAVAVGVGQLPDARRRSDVERSGVPHRTFGEHHLVGEDRALVEPAVAIRVFQPKDPVRLLRSCFSTWSLEPDESAT